MYIDTHVYTYREQVTVRARSRGLHVSIDTKNGKAYLPDLLMDQLISYKIS